jgi:hypothetical protein
MIIGQGFFHCDLKMNFEKDLIPNKLNQNPTELFGRDATEMQPSE